MRTLLLALAAGACAPGCAAGSISGEVDGDPVPSFGDAAFGIVTADGAGAVQGYALPRESCSLGAGILSDTLDDTRPIEERNTEIAKTINDNVPEDSWYAIVTVIAGDQDDIEDDTVDLEDPSEVSVDFVLCTQDTEATVNDDGTLDNGANCYSAAEGDVELDIADDASTYRVRGEGIEMQDGDGDDVGDVNLDFTFAHCAALDDALDALAQPVDN